MLRGCLAVALLVAVPARAQQNVDISGEQFTSGASDAKLAALGHEAALSGKRLVITAPSYWHARIASKVRAGGHADVVMRDGFFENILIRVEDKAVSIEVKPSRSQLAARPKARAAQVSQASAAGHARNNGAAPSNASHGIDASQSDGTAETVQAAPSLSHAAAQRRPDVDAIRQRLEKRLNDGRAARGSMDTARLLPGDLIFVDGPVRAVVRREGLNPQLFWLAGDLDLRRTELKPLGGNRYRVLESLRPGAYTLRETSTTAPSIFTGKLPEHASSERSALEQHYNDGRTIEETMSTSALRRGDLIYSGNAAAVVLRRNGASLSRYWLIGTVDLGQPALQKEGRNKYRVVGALR
ncbi:MAG: hypothetical protein WBW61_11005 [Rhodanobacteraceae bacterium]